MPNVGWQRRADIESICSIIRERRSLQMIFNSPVFVVFLICTFALYWLPLLPKGGHRRLVLLIASYVFYGWWDWRYLGLILFCSLVSYTTALQIDGAKGDRARKVWLTIGVVVPLAVLVVFKYYDFFITSLVDGMARIGLTARPLTLGLILPVGISFFTFQALSYTIDVHRGSLRSERDPIAFLAFLAFFPQLVAGPIERATTFLPQITANKPFSYENAVVGCRLILIGAFKKMVVADRLAPVADAVFDHPTLFEGLFNLLGAACFAVQIYCDFSGYSDIALGTGKLFNIDLMRNFDRPYLALSLREFWGRWHISLSTWFRDYVYIPLGGNKGGGWHTGRNLFITFLLSGLWHGANWTFVAWGALHGCALVVERMMGSGFQRIPLMLRWTLTMMVVLLGWIFFRATDIGSAMLFLERSFKFNQDDLFLLKRLLTYAECSPFALACTFAFATLLILMDRITAAPTFLARFHRHTWLRYGSYIGLIVIVLFFGTFTDQRAFIYFQF
jgi:D-alanyl-lipoteichoic acid acyltransferase DltB (MBOAT superfamily)